MSKPDQNEIIQCKKDDPIAQIHDERPTLDIKNSEITERYLRIEGDWFSFDGREYLKDIYNLDASRMIIKASRQCEKCCQRNTRILLDNGWKEIKDVEVGDTLISAKDDANISKGKVTWKSDEYTKPCYKIETEFGHKLIAGEEHPIRQWGRWTDAKNLDEGDIIATVCNYPNVTGLPGLENKQDMVDDLEEHVDSDIFWDKVKNIEYVGEKPCYDISVEPHKSFISEGIITHNSTTVSNIKIIENMTNDHYSSLFVAPTMQQTQRFSNDRLERRIRESEYINRFFYEPAERKNVYEKHLANGSVMWLSYARDDADRIRGISADRVFLDEIQDIQKDVIPVIEECMSHAPNPRSMYTGTPKTKQNTIEKYWKMSTQCEWVVRCTGCNKYNILGLKNVGKTGPICADCGKDIHPHQHGSWQHMKDPKNAKLWGFRITQLMVPWVIESEDKWKNLVDKIEDQYTNKEIYNEVLGLPYSTAAHPIKKKDLKAASGNYDVYENKNGDTRKHDYFAGIDIGSGDSGELGDDATSYTAICILRRSFNDNFKVVYLKKYTGVEADPDFALKDMKKHIQRFDCEKVGIDWGLSQHERNDLRKSIGYQAVVPVWYTNISGMWRWDEKDLKFNVNRTESLTELFQGIKEKSIELPEYSKNKETLNDFLSVFNETSRRGELIYDHEDEDPDDVVHAVNYARIVAKVYYGMTRYEIKEADMVE